GHRKQLMRTLRHFSATVKNIVGQNPGKLFKSGSPIPLQRKKTSKTRENRRMTRADAWCLLTEFTQSESLRKHALAVEACMRAYARKFGDDEERWGVVGLIHDFDYEKYPSLDDHPYKGNAILTERGVAEEIRRAIMSHADYTGVTRDSNLEK